MADGLPTPRRYLAIAAVSFGTALVVIDGAIATVALPTLARDLGVDNSAAVLVVTVYQLVLVMTLLPFATLGDRIGHRRLYQLGQLIFTVATLLCFFARSLPFLLVVRAVQALGAAAALSVSSAMIRSIYPAKQLGRGLGLNSVVVSSASALAPTARRADPRRRAWPWVFASAVPFGIVSLLLGRALPDPEPRDEPFDTLGAVLCAAMFGPGHHRAGSRPSTAICRSSPRRSSASASSSASSSSAASGTSRARSCRSICSPRR